MEMLDFILPSSDEYDTIKDVGKSWIEYYSKGI
jgi:hypothetical protein